MSVERNKGIVRKLQDEVWSKGNLDILEEILTPDFICHFLTRQKWHGYEGVRKVVSSIRSAFPDWTEQVEDIIAEGDRVVTRFTSRGTHQGEFNGIPATGRKVEISEVAILRIENRKIAEQWGFPDITSLMQQLSETP